MAKAAANTPAQNSGKDLFSDLPEAAPRRVSSKAARAGRPTSAAEARQHARLGGDAKAVLAQGHARLRLSARGYDRVLRVARTLADLADCERVGADHVEKALSLRRAGPT